MDHENLCLVIELNVLDHRVLDAQQGAPYAGVLHAVLRSAVSDLRQARNLDRERRVAVQAQPATHRSVTRATNDDAFENRAVRAKTTYMQKIVRRIATVAAAGLAPLTFVTVISPAVSSADCAFGTEWLDPVANVCRRPVPL